MTIISPAAAAASPAPLPLADQASAYVSGIWQWLDTHTIDVMMAVAAGTIIAALLLWARGVARRRADKAGAHMLHLLWSTLGKTTRFFIVMVAARLVVGYANTPQQVHQTIAFLFIVAATFQVAIWVRAIVIAWIRHRAGATVDHGDTINNAMGLIKLLVTVVLFAIASIVVLDNLGVNITGLIAGLGIGGIAIGMAAKGVFEDLFAALAIIFDRPFVTGETIQYDQTTATVARIGLKSTRLQALSGEAKIISNTNLLAKEITNVSRAERRRISFVLGLVGQTSIDKLRALPDLLATCITGQGHHFVRAGFSNFGASSLDFDVVFDVVTQDAGDVAAARHAVGVAIIELLSAHGYETAYPTQVSYTAAPDGKLIMPYEPSAKGARTGKPA